MKRSSAVLLCAAALAVAVLAPSLHAQDNPPPPEKGPRGNHPRMEKMGEHMAKQLGLSVEQQTQIKAIREAARPQLEAIRNDATLTREQKRAQAQAIQKDTQAKVDALLTPEQRTKAQAMREKAKQRAKEHREHKGPHGPGSPEDFDGPPPPPPAGK